MCVDTLLDLKKQRLLLSLQQTVSGDKTNHENRLEERTEEEKEDEGKGEEESSREYNHYKDDGNDYQGIKCQAPMQEVEKLYHAQKFLISSLSVAMGCSQLP